MPLPAQTGAGDRSRTCDLLITNQLLYQLSYTGQRGGASYGPFSETQAWIVIGIEIEHSLNKFGPLQAWA
jgi:hypothetical protein